MAASVNDKFSKVSTGARPTTTTVASIRSVSGTSLICDDLTGWDTDAAVHFSTYQVDGQGDVVAGTQTDMKGTVSGNTISNIIITGGTDTGNAVGDIVQQLPTARYAKDLADGLLVSHDQDGTLKAGAVDNSAAIADGVITPAKRSGGFAMGTITTGTLGTTGNKAVTGIGFTPKRVEFHLMPTASSSATAFMANGAMDASGLQFYVGIAVASSAQVRVSNTNAAFAHPTGTATTDLALSFEYVSMDADGFTINVTTASSAFAVRYLAYA